MKTRIRPFDIWMVVVVILGLFLYNWIFNRETLAIHSLPLIRSSNLQVDFSSFTISRSWDILIGPILALLLNAVYNYAKTEEKKKVAGGLIGGLLAGMILGLGISLKFGLAPALVAGLTLSLFACWLIGLTACLSYCLSFGLIVGMVWTMPIGLLATIILFGPPLIIVGVSKLIKIAVRTINQSRASL